MFNDMAATVAAPKFVKEPRVYEAEWRAANKIERSVRARIDCYLKKTGADPKLAPSLEELRALRARSKSSWNPNQRITKFLFEQWISQRTAGASSSNEVDLTLKLAPPGTALPRISSLSIAPPQALPEDPDLALELRPPGRASSSWQGLGLRCLFSLTLVLLYLTRPTEEMQTLS